MTAQGVESHRLFPAELTFRYCEYGSAKTRADSNGYAMLAPAPYSQFRLEIGVENLAKIRTAPAPFSPFRAYDQEVR